MIRLFAAMVRLFPRSFRRQFGPEMLQRVEDDYRRARQAGVVRAAVFAVATTWDLFRAAVAERVDPGWSGGHDDQFDERGVGTMMSDWGQDLRYAVRSLLRAPGFTVVTVVTLGLAMGANAGIFSVVDAVLLEGLPYPDDDDLVYIAASAPGSDLPEEFGVSREFLIEYREQAEGLVDAALYDRFTATLRVGDRAERVWMSSPATSLFATLGVPPMLGRLPTEDDQDVMLISHALWTTWFNRNPDALGQSHFTSLGTKTIIGVMGPDFWFPDDGILLWIPRVFRTEDVVPGRFGAPMVARLAPGTTPEVLAEELGRLASRLPEKYGGSANYARVIEQHRPVVRSLREELLGDISGPLWVLLGSVGIVLLVACANVTNLFLVRAEGRQRDLSVRRALGAGRRQLIRAQMAEAVVVAGAAGVVAVLVAWMGVPVFLAAAPDDVPRLSQVHLNGATILFTAGIAVFTALACGLVPALRASAGRMTRLREGGRGSTRGRHWVRDGLVVAQTALALVLLVGSALLVRSFQALRSVDPGYETADVFTFQMAPEGEHLTDGPSWAAFHMDFMDRLRALPTVESVGIVENVPLNEGVRTQRIHTEATVVDEDGGALIGMTFAAGDYWETMGISLLRGRAFVDADHVSEHGNVIISASAAELLWPGEDPVGRRLKLQQLDQWETVVGVVEDVLQYGYRDDPQPLVYFPMVGHTADQWWLSSPAYVVRTPRAAEIAPEVREMVREVAPGAPMYRVYTMDGLAADSMVELSFTTLTLALASGLALLLGAIGLFGVLSYVVAERTREIGVRMALGAEARRVQRMVVVQGVRVVLVGVVLGLAVAAVSTRVLATLLYGVAASDLATFAGTSAAMLGVGLLASWLPARRASHVDPIEALRAT